MDHGGGFSVDCLKVALPCGQSSAPIGEIKNRNNRLGGIEMESYHWFLLGMMVAFTPSLLVLGVLLARSIDKPVDTPHSTSEL